MSLITVGQLSKLLEREDPNRIVILQKDSEGNGHSPLSSLWTGAYRAQTTWSGEVGLEELTPDDIEQGFSEDDVIKGKPALILCPVN